MKGGKWLNLYNEMHLQQYAGSNAYPFKACWHTNNMCLTINDTDRLLLKAEKYKSLEKKNFFEVGVFSEFFYWKKKQTCFSPRTLFIK